MSNRTFVTILQHPRERFHAIGTARIAKLGLRRSSLEVPRNVFARNLEHEVVVPEATGLLFPSESARPLDGLAAEEHPQGLVVLDGTWSQARGLYRANSWIQRLPHYSLEPTAPTRYRIRKEPRSGYVSTLEAIVMALSILEPETPGLQGLLDVFDTMIDRQIVHQGANPRWNHRRQPRRESGDRVASGEAGGR